MAKKRGGEWGLRVVVLTHIALASPFADASSRTYVVTGDDYLYECNASGSVIDLRATVSEQVREESDQSVAAGWERIYIGRSCDARSSLLGSGKWCWASDGFIVDLEAGTLDFAEQRPLCRSFGDAGEDCLC